MPTRSDRDKRIEADSALSLLWYRHTDKSRVPADVALRVENALAWLRALATPPAEEPGRYWYMNGGHVLLVGFGSVTEWMEATGCAGAEAVTFRHDAPDPAPAVVGGEEEVEGDTTLRLKLRDVTYRSSTDGRPRHFKQHHIDAIIHALRGGGKETT